MDGITHVSGSQILVSVTGIPVAQHSDKNTMLLVRFTNLVTLEVDILSVLTAGINETLLTYVSDLGDYDLKIEIGKSYDRLVNGILVNTTTWQVDAQTITMTSAPITEPVDVDPIPGGTTQLSGNPIQIEISATDEIMAGKSNYMLALRITCGALMGSPFVEAIAPDADNVVKFQISGFVDQPMDVEFENPPLSKVVFHPALSRMVSLDTGEIYIDEAGDRIVDWNGLLQNTQIRVIKGYLRDYELGLLNEDFLTFNSEYVEGGKFLTHMPQNHKVSASQIMKLWYLGRWAAPHTVTLHCVIENTATMGNYEYTEEFVIAPTSGLIEFNMNPAMMGFIPQVLLLPPGTLPTAYTFWLEDETGDVSERRRFIIDNNYYEREFYFYSRNPFSVVDSVWLHGEFTEKLKTEAETAARQVPVGSGTKVASLATISASGQRSWEINTGVKTVAELKALRDFLESKERWMVDQDQVVNGTNWWRLIPVVIESGEYEIENSMTDIPNFEINVLEAHV